MRSEQLRARLPDESGEVVRDGVTLHYDVYGDADTTVVLMPTWSIVDSRVWKAQVPFLARHYRVVTFDGRGCGQSDRPRGAGAFADTECAADVVAVLDATATRRAVLVGFSCGATWAVHVAAEHPERVLGVVAIAPSCELDVAGRDQERQAWLASHNKPRGWQKYSRDHWLNGKDGDFREFFFAEMYSEPHSTKQREDALLWSSAIDAQTLVDSTAARLNVEGWPVEPVDDIARRVRCPVHVIHGTADRVRPSRFGQGFAELTGGTLTLIDGGGHAPLTRDPVRVNNLIRNFVESVTAQPPGHSVWRRALRRRRRALFLSSPIGLGHARRDVAIAKQLRELRPDLDVEWLAQSPVTRVLDAEAERVHPASRHLLGESAHVEAEAGEHDLHAFEAIRRMDEILVANFMLFSEVVEEDPPDLVIGDEAWDVDYFLHENPELKRFAFAWLTDFVGWLPMPDGGQREAALTADYNTEMVEHRARYPRLRDRSIFVGNPDDVVTARFGPGLPVIRDWTEENFSFAGYVQGSAPPSGARLTQLRRRLGLRPDHRLCVVTVGGTAVGDPLLHRVLDAVPIARRLMPDLHFLVVTGPRIDPRSLPNRNGVRVRGYVPDLADYLAAADVAVVQGGLSTCMELTAAGTPFIYVPLEHHFEQNFHVRHRLDRYRAGHALTYAQACDPDVLAKTLVEQATAETHYRPVETDGAARAAAMLAELV
ncbi:MAG: alpha/beta fold hydrolase [Mycobacteriaceae bacterium]|nr:alpha/beta fold hydrolase [Mycobacteriaceae bacterium]